MKKVFFQLALLSFAVLASDEQEVPCSDEEYMNYQQKYQKNLTKQEHKEEYCNSKKKIEDLNKKSSKAQFEINNFADMTIDEKKQFAATKNAD